MGKARLWDGVHAEFFFLFIYFHPNLKGLQIFVRISIFPRSRFFLDYCDKIRSNRDRESRENRVLRLRSNRGPIEDPFLAGRKSTGTHCTLTFHLGLGTKKQKRLMNASYDLPRQGEEFSTSFASFNAVE